MPILVQHRCLEWRWSLSSAVLQLMSDVCSECGRGRLATHDAAHLLRLLPEPPALSLNDWHAMLVYSPKKIEAYLLSLPSFKSSVSLHRHKLGECGLVAEERKSVFPCSSGRCCQWGQIS